MGLGGPHELNIAALEAGEAVVAGKPVPKRIVTQEGVFPMEVAAKEFPNRKY